MTQDVNDLIKADEEIDTAIVNRERVIYFVEEPFGYTSEEIDAYVLTCVKVFQEFFPEVRVLGIPTRSESRIERF